MAKTSTRRPRDARRCPTCSAPLYGKSAKVYRTTRARGRIEITCASCKIAKVTERHRHRMENDAEYAEAQHRKHLAFLKARRLYAIRRRKQREAAHA
jgi:hypothetical protein